MRELAIKSLLAAALLSGCSDDPKLTCGTGTRAMGEVCVPISTLGCGEGTKELFGECVPELDCGPDTQVVNGLCVPIVVTTCGEGTQEVDNECVPTLLVGGNFEKIMIELQSLDGVGSHTDEVRIRLEDNLLFNCSYTFNIIDAEDPADMEQLNEGGSQHDSPDARNRPGCKHLTWDDANHVFTTHPGDVRDGTSFVAAWDITDPEVPVQVGLHQEPGTTFQNLGFTNGHVFVAMRDQGLGAYLYNAPTSSTSTTGTFTRVGVLGGFTNAWGVEARGNTVFVTDLSEALVTVDVTNPAQPTQLGRVALGGTSRFLVVDGNYAYVASGAAGVTIVDVSNLAAPTVVGTIDTPGSAVRVAYSEGRIFVAAWNDVRVYDVTDPTMPRFVSAVRIRRHYEYDEIDRELPTMRIFGVAARGTDVFIGTWENPYSYHLEPDRVAPNIRLPETTTRLEFGPVPAGQTKTLSFDVLNQGTAPLTLVDNWVDGEGFTVEPKQALVPPGESVALNVTFAPTDASVQSTALLHIESDDPEYPLRKPFLSGNSPGIVVGSPLPTTTGLLIDGTLWSSADAPGDVLLLFYFATF